MNRFAPLLLIIALIPGCAYYNGMYNANRLAHMAEKAEREGRTFDANSLWGQVGVKADTMLARHGGSKWADDALLLRGKSYQRLGDCSSAITTLNRLVGTSSDSTLLEEASLLLGRCYQETGQNDEAIAAFSRLLGSRDPARRKDALFEHGRALRMSGLYAEALAVLEQTDQPRARGERAAALAGVGRMVDAISLADSLIAAGDTAAPWDSLLAIVGRADTDAASKLTDRLVAMPGASSELRAEWLLADGERLIQSAPEPSRRRVSDAMALSPDGAAGNRARALKLRLRMLEASTLDSLRAIRSDLDDEGRAGGQYGIQIARYDRAAGFVAELMDSVAHNAKASDLRTFLAAETVRDSLGMSRLAERLFHRVVDEHPESPYAAKALLALVSMGSAQADSAATTLRVRYSDNPYFLVAQGQDAPGFSALEDSLLVFALALQRPVTSPAVPRRQTSPTAGSRLPEN